MGEEPTCCPLYHEAVELIGRRWTGAIVEVLLNGGAMRFSEIAAAVPELSDRLPLGLSSDAGAALAGPSRAVLHLVQREWTSGPAAVG